MRGIVEWHDFICEQLREALTKAQPTSMFDPNPVIQMSADTIQKMLDESPYTAASYYK